MNFLHQNDKHSDTRNSQRRKRREEGMEGDEQGGKRMEEAEWREKGKVAGNEKRRTTRIREKKQSKRTAVAEGERGKGEENEEKEKREAAR